MPNRILNTYRESDLQSYIENRIERDFTEWLPLFGQFRLLGTQVPCVFGIMDILGACNNRPVVVELKAEPASERVVGQVLRYRAAVADVFQGQVFDLSFSHEQRDNDIQLGDIEPICVVIAPSYHDMALASLTRIGWPLVAQRLDEGHFSITQNPSKSLRVPREQTHLAKLLQPISSAYYGQSIGVTIANRHKRILSAQSQTDHDA